MLYQPPFHPPTCFLCSEASNFCTINLHLYVSIADSQQHKDLSHPVHADNCVLDEVKGECNKVSPAYTWRDYRLVIFTWFVTPTFSVHSAILYINEEFEGGKFFFAHSTKKLTPQVRGC